MEFATTDVVSAVGITLVHFMWQAAAIGLVTAAVLATCPGALARTRYGIAAAGLAAMTLAPLATFAFVWGPAPALAGALPAFATGVEVHGSTARLAGVPVAWSAWLPPAVAVWAFGVVVLTTRLLVAWLRTEHVRRRDVHPVSEELTSAVSRLAHDIGIRRRVTVFESRWVDAPAIIGWIRPTILLPIGALTGLSVQQIEAVLSHELAHIRRHDYLVNVLQNLTETVFFFHPAVWWLSKRIRVEREHCCDDVAVETCGNPVVYARALAALEESRQRNAVFALAATDGSLVHRVRRLVGTAQDDRRDASLPIAACVAVILAVVGFGAVQAKSSVETAKTLEAAVHEAQGALSAAASMPEGDSVVDGAATGRQTSAAAIGYERVDGDTIRVAGELYQRGTPEDLQRLLRNRTALASRANASVTAPMDPQVPAPTAIRVGGGIREPRRIDYVPPVYPEPARAAGVQGLVILEATIDTDGSVTGIKVLRSIPDLDQAAINAVRQWRYQPTLLNGQPVAVMTTVTVNFALTPPRVQFENDGGVRRVVVTSASDSEGTAAPTPPSALTVNPPAPLPAGVLRVGGSVRPPIKVRHVSPAYPKLARESNVSGVVVFDTVVDENGNVVSAQVVRSVPMLDAAALEAVRQWQYVPTLVNGVATPVAMTVTVNFSLE
jgi:TonB family protein